MRFQTAMVLGRGRKIDGGAGGRAETFGFGSILDWIGLCWIVLDGMVVAKPGG